MPTAEFGTLFKYTDALSSTDTSGSVTVGHGQERRAKADATVGYAVGVDTVTASATVTLDPQDGATALSAGTATIHDGDGLDFEGTTLAMATLYGLEITNAGTANVTVTDTGTLKVLGLTVASEVVVAPDGVYFQEFGAGRTLVGSGQEELTLVCGVGSDARVRLIGK